MILNDFRHLNAHWTAHRCHVGWEPICSRSFAFWLVLRENLTAWSLLGGKKGVCGIRNEESEQNKRNGKYRIPFCCCCKGCDTKDGLVGRLVSESLLEERVREGSIIVQRQSSRAEM